MFEKAFKRAKCRLDDKVVLSEEYLPKIKEAASAPIAQYDTKILEALERFKMLRRFDPKSPPNEFPKAAEGGGGG